MCVLCTMCSSLRGDLNLSRCFPLLKWYWNLLKPFCKVSGYRFLGTVNVMFLCHLLGTGCLINHNCNFLSFYFFLKPNGRLQESLKDHRHWGEAEHFLRRAGGGDLNTTTSPRSKVASHRAQHSQCHFCARPPPALLTGTSCCPCRGQVLHTWIMYLKSHGCLRICCSRTSPLRAQCHVMSPSVKEPV